MTTDLCTDDVVVHIGGPQIISQSETRAVVGGVGGGGAELGRRLLVAAREGDTAAVLELMAKGTPFATDWLGTSPLHLAASNGHVETCAVLLRAGVSRDSRTKVDRTALHLAAYEGHERVVALLVEQGAQVDCRDMLRMTPLHWAAQRGHVAAARELLRAGADPLAVSKFGGTAVSLARRAPPAARDHISLVVEEAVRAQEAAHSVHALVSEIQESTFTQKKTSPIEEQQHQEEEKPKSVKNSPTSESKAERHRQRDTGSEGESEGVAAQLLRRHGITLLPADEGTTVLSALQSGRSVVLSDAGKLMLKESAAPTAPVASTAPAPAAPDRAGVVLTATAVKPPARAGVKIFTLNNNQLVPANTDNSQNLQVKYVQLPAEGGGKAGAGAGRGRRAAGAPVKIILNRANFTKLLSPLSNSPVVGGAGEAGAGAGGGCAGGRTGGERAARQRPVAGELFAEAVACACTARETRTRRAAASVPRHALSATVVTPTPLGHNI